LSTSPPPGASPAQLIEDWLPGQMAEAVASFGGSSPRVRVSLSGTDGGDWELRVEDGTVRVERLLRVPGQPRPADPEVWIRQPARDFLAAFFADPDLPELSSATMDLGAIWRPLLSEADSVVALAGRVRFEVLGRRHRRFSLDLAFGRPGILAGQPRATVEVDAPTCEKLAAGTANPAQVLLSGSLKIAGDRAFALQVLLFAASRFGKR
jgi:hypothetical protein